METQIKKQSWGVITVECNSYETADKVLMIERTVKYDNDLLLKGRYALCAIQQKQRCCKRASRLGFIYAKTKQLYL